MKNVLGKVLAFCKSNTGHKLFGYALGAASTYLLSGHVDVPALVTQIRGLFGG
jgi:hypothetical protein